MDFNGSDAPEAIRVLRNRSRSQLTRDAGAITMDFDELETLAIRALGGADALTVGDLAQTGIDDVAIDLGAADAAADTVRVEGTARRDRIAVTRSKSEVLVGGLPARTRIAGSEPALDTLLIDGDDDVTVAPDVAELIQTIVD